MPVRAAMLAVVLALASASPASGLIIVRAESKELPAGMTTTTSAKCPEEASVTGGGVFIKNGNTKTSIHSSYPIDDGDDDIRRDDGWRGTANSTAAGDKRTSAIAICSRAGKYRYLQVGIDELKPGQDGTHVQCPLGEAVAGGGAFLAGTHTGSGLAATEPWDGPSDLVGWAAAANNTSGGGLLMRVFAICDRSGSSYQYLTETGSAAASSQGYAPKFCPAGTKATGGGGNTGTATTTAELAAGVPLRNPAGGGSFIEGWGGYVNNLSGVPLDFTTSVVCRG